MTGNMQYLIRRSHVMAPGWGIFKDHPILGGGPGTVTIFFTQYRSPDYYNFGINNVTTSSHNYFIDVLAQTGIFGLAAILLLLGVVLAPALRGIFRSGDSQTRGLQLAGAVSVIGLLAFAITSPFLTWVIGAAPVWTALGFCAGVSSIGRMGPISPMGPIPFHQNSGWVSRIAFGLVLALGLIVLPVSAFYGIQYFRSQMWYAEGLMYLESAKWYMDGQGNPDAGQIESMTGYFKDSIDHFNQALKIDPTNISSYYKLGSAQTYLFQIENNAASKQVGANDLKGAGEHAALAKQYLQEALKSYERLAQLSPDYAEIHFNLGLVYNFMADTLRSQADQEKDPARSADLKKAADYIGLSVEHFLIMGRQSHKPEVAMQLGQRLEQLKQYPQALEVLKTLCNRNPENKDLVQEYLTVAEIAKDPQATADAKARLEAQKKKK